MAQVNKISSFKSFTEVKNQETTMKLREENNAKRQETVGKIGAILDEMGLTSLSELDEDKKQALISKMFGNVSEDEAEDIEDEINKLGEPKKLEDEKLEEGNAFIFAASKAKQEGKSEFEFNGKKYKVTLKKDTGLKEGNAFGDAVKKAKEDGETEFEFDGETYKVEESSVNEGKHGMAKKLLKGIVDGNSSEAEGIKLSKELADHYLYWINTSPYGKKNENLPLYMLIDASFNWGIERGLPKELKAELDALKDSVKKNESFLNEARSIAKIQNEWSKVTTEMADLAAKWKAAEGDAKAELLAQMKEKTAVKKGLESELDAAVAGKDKDLELVVSEAFYRLPKDVIGNELYLASQNLTNLYNSSATGNDIDTGVVDSIVKQLNTVKKSAKKFNSAEEVAGTVYEGAVKQFDADFNDMVKNIKSGYGWIDPEYVADTWENSSDSIDFELVKGEIYKRLIAAKLLAYADDEDEESAGQYIKSLKELGIKESVEVNETEVNEEEIKSDDEFKEYAMSVLKKAFGADFDEAKAGEVADGILKKCDGDYGACVGMLNSSLGESVVTETTNIVKILRKLGWAGETWTPQELASQIKNLDDSTLIAWSKDNKGIPNTPLAFQMKLVDAEMEKRGLSESVVTEKFDAKYWEDYHEGASKIENPNDKQLEQEVSGCVEDWNDNNEMGEENEVTSAGEKKVFKLAKEFVKAKGWISSDIIEAMIAQES